MGWGLSSSSILMDKYYFEPPFNGWGGVYPHPPWVYHLPDHVVTNVGVGFHRFAWIGLCLGYNQRSANVGVGFIPILSA